MQRLATEHGNAKQIEADAGCKLRVDARIASEDSMRKLVYLSAAISLVLCSVSLRAQGPARNDIKNEDTKVLTARNVSSQPLKSATEDPYYSIGPEDVLTIDV